MILQATGNLIELMQRERRNYTLTDAYAKAIARFGSLEDARALFAAFLEDFARKDLTLSYLLTPIRILGDSQLAHEIFQQCVSNGKLRNGMPEEILFCLGYMGYLPSEALLWSYVTESENYWVCRAACLGLLHLPCTTLKAAIEEAIRASFGRGLFQEFLPALASKTGKSDLIQDLYEWGSTTASTDCNGGLVLGIALYGEAGHSYFQRLLWDSHWEAGDSATGTRYYTYASCRLLGLSLLDLYAQLQEQLQQECSHKQLLHSFDLVKSMLFLFIEDDLMPHPTFRFLPDPVISTQRIYRGLFEWSDPNHDDSIIGLVDKYSNYDTEAKRSLKQDFRDAELRLCTRIEREIERQQFSHKA